MKKRASLLELACILFIAVVLGALAATQGGCQLVSGLGRDLTAMADGMAGDSSANAAAIRGKEE